MERHGARALDTLAITDENRLAGPDAQAVGGPGARRGLGPACADLAGWLLAALPLLLARLVTGRCPRCCSGLVVAGLLCRFGSAAPPKAVEATGRQVGGGRRRRGGVGRVQRDHAQRAADRPARPRHLRAVRRLAGPARLAADHPAGGGVRRARPGAQVRQHRASTPRTAAVVPQFMPGPPLLFAAGDWLGGMLLTPAVLGALAVLMLAGVVGRLAGARWAPVAALAFAVSLPILYTSRTTFSEIPSLMLLFGGLALVPRRPVAGGRAGRGLGKRRWAGWCSGWPCWSGSTGCATCCPCPGVRRAADRLARLGRPQGALGPPLLAGLAVGAGWGCGGVRAGPALSVLSVRLAQSAAGHLRRRSAAHAGRYARRALAWPGPAAQVAAGRRGRAGRAGHGGACRAAVAADRDAGGHDAGGPADRRVHREDAEGQRPAGRRHPALLRAVPALGELVRRHPRDRAGHAGAAVLVRRLLRDGSAAGGCCPWPSSAGPR